MRYLLATSIACATLGLAALHTAAQQAQNPFPLAAPPGRDSNARQVAPPGAVNQGPYDMNTWKYGNAPVFTAPPGTSPNPTLFTSVVSGNVSATDNGGIFVDFDNTARHFTFGSGATAGSFDFSTWFSLLMRQ